MVAKALKEFVRQLGIELANHAAGERDVLHQTGPPRQVDNDAGQRLVQRHIGVAVAAQAFFVANGAGHGLAKADADIFHRVVAVDVQVAVAIDFEVNQAVAGNLLQHMVKKTDAGAQIGLAGAVQVDAHGDARLCRVAADFGNAVGGGGGNQSSRSRRSRNGHRESFSAANMRALSSALPTVSRRQFARVECIVETFLISTLRACMPA